MGQKILVCGFDGMKNPARLIVNKLSDENTDQDTHFVILKSSYSRMESQLDTLIQDLSPDFILLTGVSLERKSINIERVAVNIDDCKMKDSDGEKRIFKEIVRGGVGGYITNFEVEKAYKVFVEIGLPVRYSNNAGNYLCNHAYYFSFHLCAKYKNNAKICFIHIPQIVECGDKSWIINEKGLVTAFSNLVGKLKKII